VAFGRYGLPLPGAIVKAVSIGTTATVVYKGQEGRLLDWTIMNNSINTLYIIQTEAGLAADGMPILPGDRASCQNWVGDLVLIASAATSDTRLILIEHGMEWPRVAVGDDGYQASQGRAPGYTMEGSATGVSRFGC
jgi:hypothetical protein